MSSSQPILLDPYGDAIVPPGYTLVTTELEWLRITTQINGTSPSLVVRGPRLAQWARLWWETQGHECSELSSPGLRVQRSITTLSTIDAQTVAQELRTAWGDDNWPEFLTPTAILAALYPTASAVWQLPPSSEPATVAQVAGAWLAWLYQTQLTAWPVVHKPILAAWVATWQREAPQSLTLLPLVPAEALALYRTWVGLAPVAAPRLLRQVLIWAGPCPVTVPSDWVASARQQWESDLPRYVAARPTGTEAGTATVAWWSQVVSQHLHPSLLPLLLGVVVQFVQRNPQALSAELLRSLRPHLSAADYTKLAQQLPPPLPGPLPTEPEAVLRWTTDEYLPYRLWQANLEHPVVEALDAVRECAQAFSKWLLATYPALLAGATRPYQHLYWSQADRIQPQNANEVVVWVIADGLGWPDARYVAQRVCERGHLATTHAAACFGLLPTITHFTKVPVRAGYPYTYVAAHHSTLQADAASDVRDLQDPVLRARHLNGGQLLVWKPLQPDKTYHETAEASTVRRNVRGVLDTLAQTIVDIAHEIPRALALRIHLTTDHGRMLGVGQRTVAVPSGFEAHGRVAYRLTPGPPPSAVPNVTWLDPDYFGLPGWAGVIQDENSFRVVRKDGSQASGPDNFSHGGMWPEEVVVPSFTLHRDAVAVRVTGRASGRARPGTVGTVALRLLNEADRPVRLRRFTLHGEAALTLDVAIATVDLPGQENTNYAITLSPWPDGLRLSTARCMIEVELPDGTEQEFELENQLDADEFQTRQTDLLGDL